MECNLREELTTIFGEVDNFCQFYNNIWQNCLNCQL